jgi:NAD(P)-dependent dehydrogenase (short-subunit alcohol dehydrogenase family)
MITLENKTALVVGSLNEVARGAAAALEAAGAAVIFATSQPEAARPSGLSDGMMDVTATSALWVNLDDPQALHTQLTSLPPFGIAVLSPGWYDFGDFMDTTPADWDAALGENFEAMVYAMQAAAKVMIERGAGGRIIILSSVAALMPFSQTSVVGTTLTALWGLAKMAAVDLAPHHITVNIIASGWLETAWYAPYLGEGRPFVEKGIPLGAVGKPGDVGGLCAFLASDLAAYITGAIIPVDGGYLLTPGAGKSPYPQV